MKILLENEQIQMNYFIYQICKNISCLFFQIKFILRSNLDAKVYIGNVPTDDLTDRELLQFFKPFGKISGLKIDSI